MGFPLLSHRSDESGGLLLDRYLKDLTLFGNNLEGNLRKSTFTKVCTEALRFLSRVETSLFLYLRPGGRHVYTKLQTPSRRASLVKTTKATSSCQAKRIFYDYPAPVFYSERPPVGEGRMLKIFREDLPRFFQML